MVIIAERNKPEGLQGSVGGRTYGAKHFCHASNRAGLSLECDFDKISRAQGPRQTQKAASHGNSLKFGFGALAIFQHDEGQN